MNLLQGDRFSNFRQKVVKIRSCGRLLRLCSWPIPRMNEYEFFVRMLHNRLDWKKTKNNCCLVNQVVQQVHRAHGARKSSLKVWHGFEYVIVLIGFPVFCYFLLYKHFMILIVSF